MKEKQKTYKNKYKIIAILSMAGFILCTLLLLYPVISDEWNRYRDQQLITDYNSNYESDDRANEEAYKNAQEYNAMLKKSGRSIITDAMYEPDEEYESQLNIAGNEMMGYVEIPCIDVMEPIYHYTTDDVLANGIGHIHGSSLPVGGDGTHTVLTGHRGLPTQKFFSDLDKVKEGDKFYIHVLDKILAYEVDDISVVLPDEIDSLLLEDGKDLATLVTCTPYGVNTHRLLVTGHRVEYDGAKNEAGQVTTEEHTRIIDPAVYVFIGFMLFIALVLLRNVISNSKKHRNLNSNVQEKKGDVHDEEDRGDAAGSDYVNNSDDAGSSG